jgi:hypothetical protein
MVSIGSQRFQRILPTGAYISLLLYMHTSMVHHAQNMVSHLTTR